MKAGKLIMGLGQDSRVGPIASKKGKCYSFEWKGTELIGGRRNESILKEMTKGDKVR